MPELGEGFNITRPDFGKNPLQFLKEVRAELFKVTWPTRPMVIKLTAVVIGVSVLVAVYLGALDYAFTKIMELVLNKN